MSLSSLIIVLNFPSEKQHPSHKWEPDKCDATKMLFECHKNVNYFTSEIRKKKVTYFPRHNTKWWNTIKEGYQWLKYWIGRGFKQFITQLSLTHWFTVSKLCITVFAGWVVLNEMNKLHLICNLTFNYFSATMQIIACTVMYYSHMSLSALSRQRSACDMYECNKLLMMLGEKTCVFLSVHREQPGSDQTSTDLLKSGRKFRWSREAQYLYLRRLSSRRFSAIMMVCCLRDN